MQLLTTRIEKVFLINIVKVIFLLILSIAAAEVAVGLGLVLQIQKRFKTLDMDDANRMRG